MHQGTRRNATNLSIRPPTGHRESFFSRDPGLPELAVVSFDNAGNVGFSGLGPASQFQPNDQVMIQGSQLGNDGTYTVIASQIHAVAVDRPTNAETPAGYTVVVRLA